jgi:hypothetical protein
MPSESGVTLDYTKLDICVFIISIENNRRLKASTKCDKKNIVEMNLLIL